MIQTVNIKKYKVDDNDQLEISRGLRESDWDRSPFTWVFAESWTGQVPLHS